MKPEVTPDTCDAVRESVRRVLALVGGELGVDENARGVPGDAGEVYDHVDGLVRIARRTRGDDVGRYLAQLPAEVCGGCRHQFDDGFCPLRHRRLCALQVAATPVFEAVGGALRNLNDPEYCAAHDAAAAVDDADETDDCDAGCGCSGCGESTFFG